MEKESGLKKYRNRGTPEGAERGRGRSTRVGKRVEVDKY